MQEQIPLFIELGLEYYAKSQEKQEFFAQISAKHPDEDYDAYWIARKKAESLSQKYGIVFVVYSDAYSEYRFLDWEKWSERCSNVWTTIGYYEKYNGWYD
jgi:hypothetical protein